MGRLKCSEEELSYTKGLGNRLKDLRQSKGISQVSMANAIGVSRAFISNIERGTNRVTAFVLEAYCNVLQMSPDEGLQYAYKEKKGLSYEIIMMFERMSDEDKNKILGIAHAVGIVDLTKRQR